MAMSYAMKNQGIERSLDEEERSMGREFVVSFRASPSNERVVFVSHRPCLKDDSDANGRSNERDEFGRRVGSDTRQCFVWHSKLRHGSDGRR